jgi:hypothetical protein
MTRCSVPGGAPAGPPAAGYVSRHGYTWQELYMSMHGDIALTPISGPHSIDSRYYTEYAP